MASVNRITYIGVTNDLIRRAEEHRQDLTDGFSKKYKCHKLVYYEYFRNIKDAINRETEIKKWRREKKVELIEKENLTWQDLYEEIIR